MRSKDVDKIFSDGEMSWYFDAYLEHLGEAWWPNWGEFSNYFKHAFYWHSPVFNENITILKYEDVMEDPQISLKPLIMDMFGGCEEDIDRSLKQSEQTQEKRKHRLVLKKKKDIYKDYLSKKQIDSFEFRYSSELKRLGYLE